MSAIGTNPKAISLRGSANGGLAKVISAVHCPEKYINNDEIADKPSMNKKESLYTERSNDHSFSLLSCAVVRTIALSIPKRLAIASDVTIEMLRNSSPDPSAPNCLAISRLKPKTIAADTTRATTPRDAPITSSAECLSERKLGIKR
jgi:hypothetical protein